MVGECFCKVHIVNISGFCGPSRTLSFFQRMAKADIGGMYKVNLAVAPKKSSCRSGSSSISVPTVWEFKCRCYQLGDSSV